MLIKRRIAQNKKVPVRRHLGVCLFLSIIILAVYGQVGQHEFLNIDDPTYVTKNAFVKKGLTLDGLGWAFSLENKDKTYWHPLTWISHMLDVHLYGMDAGRHLFTNVLLHIINSILLFSILRRMTHALWPSAIVASLFALHPLNIEAVAWVTERKSVLSTTFWMLTLGVYQFYAQRRTPARYLAVSAVFGLGLMAKPMLVTLPFVLLLLDYWPLERLRPDKSDDGDKISPILRRVLEKLPLFLLSAGAVYVASLSLQRQGNFISLAAVPLNLRIGNALISCVKYIIKMILPLNLSVFYPYPERLPLWQPAGALLILAGLSVLVIRHYRDRPYLLVGWLWYLGTLLPVLGLVQAGLWPAMADRFAYIPLIGLFIIVAWGGYELFSRYRNLKFGFAAAAAILFSLMVATWMQLGHWRNSIAIFHQALRVDDSNPLAHNNLGVALRKRGRLSEAIAHYDAAIRLKPDYPAAHHNLGLALLRVGRFDEAVIHFRQAMQMKPADAAIKNGLKTALDAQREMNETIAAMQRALEKTPDDPLLHYRLANLCHRNRDTPKAIRHYKKALALRPDFKEALNDLAIVFAVNGDYENALAALKQMVTLQPDNPVHYYSMASVLARQNKVDESIDWLKRAIQRGFRDLGRIKTDENLDNIRKSPRYQQLVKSN
jgi:tetratricopeptide (TPR) repeat protein